MSQQTAAQRRAKDPNRILFFPKKAPPVPFMVKGVSFKRTDRILTNFFHFKTRRNLGRLCIADNLQHQEEEIATAQAPRNDTKRLPHLSLRGAQRRGNLLYAVGSSCTWLTTVPAQHDFHGKDTRSAICCFRFSESLQSPRTDLRRSRHGNCRRRTPCRSARWQAPTRCPLWSAPCLRAQSAA